MPEKRGKRRQRERDRERRQQRRAEHERHEHEREEASPATSDPPPARSAAVRPPAEESLPSKRVRYAAFVLAIITLFVGILTFATAFSAGTQDVDIVLRAVGGATLIVTAIGIGIIALFAQRVQAWFRARQR